VKRRASARFGKALDRPRVQTLQAPAIAGAPSRRRSTTKPDHRRQRLQGRTLQLEPLAVASIAAPDDLVDEAAIGNRYSPKCQGAAAHNWLVAREG
jgi:hypothetical protein